VREQGIALKDHSDVALVHGHGSELAPVHEERAFVGVEEARDNAQERGLARAGRSEQGNELAGLDLEVDGVGSFFAGVRLGQTADV
jgi:hypothetical protein